jgi:HYDIN/CFA65/VesB family protein
MACRLCPASIARVISACGAMTGILRSGMFFLALTAAACGGQSSPSAPTPTATTRILGLSGNLTFGSVAVGQRQIATLTLTNTGNSTLTVSGLTFPSGSGDVYSAHLTGGTIAAGTSQSATITFSPTVAQSYGGTLTVNGDQTSGANTIAISGTGTSALSCTYALSARAPVDGYPNGVTVAMTVETATGCAWTAVSRAVWIQVSAPGAGNGPGTITLTEDANPAAARAGSVTVADQVVTFNQTAAEPTPAPTPPPTPPPPAPTTTAAIAEYMAILHAQTRTKFTADEKALEAKAAADGTLLNGGTIRASGNLYVASVQRFVDASLAFVRLKSQTAIDRTAVSTLFSGYAVEDAAYANTYLSVAFRFAPAVAIAEVVAAIRSQTNDVYALAILQLP